MKKLFLLAILKLIQIKAEFTITEPSELILKLTTYEENPSITGKIPNSISNFGKILYGDKIKVEILLPDKNNEFACNKLSHPLVSPSGLFVWLIKKGGCTFSAKAYNSQQSGASAVIMYHNEPKAQLGRLIPAGDSHCKLKRQQSQDSSNNDISRKWTSNR